MVCQRCGRFSPPDPETGYDADDYCPDCLALIENEDDEHEEDDILTPDDSPF